MLAIVQVTAKQNRSTSVQNQIHFPNWFEVYRRGPGKRASGLRGAFAAEDEETAGEKGGGEKDEAAGLGCGIGGGGGGSGCRVGAGGTGGCVGWLSEDGGHVAGRLREA